MHILLFYPYNSWYIRAYLVAEVKCDVYHLTGGIDYFPGPFLVTFPAGVTNVSFPILIADDEMAEVTESFRIYIKLDSLHYLVKQHTDIQISVTIQDNDCKSLILN